MRIRLRCLVVASSLVAPGCLLGEATASTGVCDDLRPMVFADGSRVQSGESATIPKRVRRLATDYGPRVATRPHGIVNFGDVQLGFSQAFASRIPPKLAKESTSYQLWRSQLVVRRVCGRHVVETARGPVEMPVYVTGGSLLHVDRRGKYLASYPFRVPLKGCWAGSVHLVDGLSVFVVDQLGIGWCRNGPTGPEIASMVEPSDWPISNATKFVLLEKARESVFVDVSLVRTDSVPKLQKVVYVTQWGPSILYFPKPVVTPTTLSQKR
jgi:hypothetical protein